MFHISIPHKLTTGLGAIVLSLLLFAIGSAHDASAATAPGLGQAASYAVIAGSTVTNTGPSTISGDLGVSPGTAVTGFPPGLVSNGSIHSADANAGQAQGAVTTAYNVLEGAPCNFDLTGQDLGGQTLTGGVYCFATSAQLTGALTLNAESNASAVFIFEIGSTLTTASNALIQVINGGVDCNVFWQVGSSATLGTGTVFAGNILALTSITLNTAASVSGRALARNGAVTLDSNHVGFDACSLPTATPIPTAAPTATRTATPSPTPVGETAAPTPVGQTPSPTPTQTPIGQTPSPIPTATPVGQTPSPIPTATPVGQTPSPTPTPTPAAPTPSPTLVVQTPTATPRATPPPPPAPTNTPSPTPGTHFPNTGGPPSQNGLPWLTLLLGLALSTIGATALFVVMNRSQQVVASKEVR